MRRRNRRLRLMYLAGPQEPLAALELLRRGEPDPGALFRPYVRQFLELCGTLDADGIVVSTRSPRSRMRVDRFTFYDLPHPLRGSTSAVYHAGQILYGVLVWLLAVVKRPDVVIASDGIVHYLTVPLIKSSGAQIIYAFHNTLWACFSTRTDPWLRVAKIFRRVFTRSVTAILSASPTISDNIRQITDGWHRPIYEFLPSYDPETFNRIPRETGDGALRILFAGRIIPEKGPLAVVDMALSLLRKGCTDIRFDMCGQGRAEDELRRQIEDRGLAQVVSFHGQLTAAELLDLYRTCHVVVAPTTTDFREGFNQVVAEGVLAGRHVITSRVCPATGYFGQSVTVVEPDDLDGYVAALEVLCRDRTRRPAALDGAMRSRFFHAECGWAAQARAAIDLAMGTHSPTRLSAPSR